MEMGSRQEIEAIEWRGEIYTCPACGYTDGFHVSFRWNAEAAQAEVYLICPSCHARFRTGWKISPEVAGR